MNKKYILCLGLVSLFTLGSCASATRSPSSVKSDSQSIELAQKLEGGEIKFHVFRDKNDISVLGYLNIKFKNCEASAASEDLSKGTELDPNSYVECDVEFNSDPIQGSIRAKINGHKRAFEVNFEASKSTEYNLEARLNVFYRDKNWKGEGELTGWVKTKLGKGTSINAEIKEKASF